MSHWIVLPVLLPLVAGAVLLVMGRRPLRHEFSVACTAALLPVSGVLMILAHESPDTIYRLGDWREPYGIVLWLDRLSATMLLLTAVVALAAQLYAWRSTDRVQRHFPALMQFQVAGLNAAFLTGDLFNLFVCFEILLIASYGLLFYGAGAARTRATLAYVVLNLIGSALFLIAVAAIYSAAGTMNLAYLSARVASMPEGSKLLAAGAQLLLVVFALKAALAPLGLWLPRAYTAAVAPVAALFAVMTKVGVYGVLRQLPLVLGGDETAQLTRWLLLGGGAATLLLGVVGLLAATRLRELVAQLVLISVGTLFCALSVGTAASQTAALYYLVHSTIVTAALFLMADLIAKERGPGGDLLKPAGQVSRPWLTGGLFFVAAVSVAGLPPMSGFVGKLLILEAAAPHAAWAWVWFLVLASSLFVILSLSRAGSVMFWRTASTQPGEPAHLPRHQLVILALVLLSAVLAVGGGPALRYLDAGPSGFAPGAYTVAGGASADPGEAP